MTWKLLLGYGRTLRQYWRTPKGHFDLVDRLRALVYLGVGLALAIVGTKIAGILLSILSGNA